MYINLTAIVLALWNPVLYNNFKTNSNLAFFVTGSGLEKGGYDGPVGGEHTTLLSHPGGIRGGDGTIVSSPLLRSTRIDPELQAR